MRKNTLFTAHFYGITSPKPLEGEGLKMILKVSTKGRHYQHYLIFCYS
jgi:hypothetical protein